MVVDGVWMFVGGVKKMLAEPDLVPPVGSMRTARDSAPDYSKYSEGELRQVLTRIDRERFPARLAEIEARLLLIESAREQ